jgi:hypothetical protein
MIREQGTEMPSGTLDYQQDRVLVDPSASYVARNLSMVYKRVLLCLLNSVTLESRLGLGLHVRSQKVTKGNSVFSAEKKALLADI